MLDYDNLETFKLLLDVTDEYGVDPLVPLESEAFFRELLTQYTGPLDTGNLANWIRSQMDRYFITLGKPPEWLQGAEWPFANGVPMIFVGQLDVQFEVASTVFHDDTSFYIFVSKYVPPVVIMQQM